MSQEEQRWDPSLPGFIPAVLRMMIGLGVLVSGIGTLRYPAGLWGFISGCALAIASYLIAMRAGNIFISTLSYARIMLWLLLAQFVLFIGMAVLLAGIKVNPYGFVIGVSILPVSVVLTFVWFTVRRRISPS